MTESEPAIDQDALDRIARLQQRRKPRPAAVEEAAGSTRRRRRSHPAIGSRIAVAGVGATAMFGITAALALDAAANSHAGSSEGLAPAAPATTAPEYPEAPPDDGAALRAVAALVAELPEGAVLTGEISESGRPIVVVVHGAAPGSAAPGAAPSSLPNTSANAPTNAATAVVAPTQLTATPVVTEIAVAAPSPAPTATTSGS